MQKLILNQLSKDLPSGKIQTGEHIVMDIFDHEFVFRKPINEAEQK